MDAENDFFFQWSMDAEDEFVLFSMVGGRGVMVTRNNGRCKEKFNEYIKQL